MFVRTGEEEQTFFVVDADAGLSDGRPYCKKVSAATAKRLRPGFLLSSNTTVSNINFQGADLRRGSDNGDLCGGGAFETPGCVRGEDCEASTGDGKAVRNVRIENVRLNDLYYDEDKFRANQTNLPASQVRQFASDLRDFQALLTAVWLRVWRFGGGCAVGSDHEGRRAVRKHLRERAREHVHAC